METRSKKRQSLYIKPPKPLGSSKKEGKTAKTTQATETSTSGSSRNGAAKPRKTINPKGKKQNLPQLENGSGNHNAQDSEDSTHLLALFPEEIWRHVFENVDSNTTFQKVSGTSQLFQQLLSGQRPRILFPEVARIMFNLYVNDGRVFPYDEEAYFGLSMNELIELRPVCRAWMRGVDDVLQNQEFQFQFVQEQHFKNMDFQQIHEENWATNLDSVQQMADFEEHFDPTHLSSGRNPFLTRDLLIRIPGDEDNDQDLVDEGLDNLVTFLGKYGTHLWYCTIAITVEETAQQMHFYKKLPSVLEKMPNLKKLSIFDSTKEPLSSGNLTQVEAHLKKKTTPNPAFPYLLFLDHRGIPNSVFHWLVDKAPQLNQMEMMGSDAKSEKDTKFALEHVPNLKNWSIWIENAAEIEKFAGAKAICSLEKLEIIFYESYVPWKQIFAALEKQCGKSLKTLTLALPKAKDNDIWQSLKLPHLQTLRLMIERPVPLDFLLPMKANLMKLDIELSGLDRRDSVIEAANKQEKIVKFFTHSKLEERNQADRWRYISPPELYIEMYRSNIWKLFGKLKKLKFDKGAGGFSKTCTREQWIKLQG